MHIAGNMWFLWIFGNNIEDSMGHVRFVAFYLFCGIIAAAAHILLSPTSAVPAVGASGAISGIMGAYIEVPGKYDAMLAYATRREQDNRNGDPELFAPNEVLDGIIRKIEAAPTGAR